MSFFFCYFVYCDFVLGRSLGLGLYNMFFCFVILVDRNFWGMFFFSIGYRNERVVEIENVFKMFFWM